MAFVLLALVVLLAESAQGKYIGVLDCGDVCVFFLTRFGAISAQNIQAIQV
jgi:hypothetical protein